MEPVASLPQVAQKLLGVVFVLEADNAIVTVPHDDDVSPCVPAAPLGGPELKDIVQVQVRQAWTCATPLRRPFLLLSPVPILQHARLEPLTDVADDALVPKPVLDKLHQPFVVNRIVKAPNVGIEYPVDGALFTAYRDRIQRVVRAAAWAGTVREPEQRWLVDGVEHLDCRPLDDFVFQRRRADGALAPISCRDGDALHRWGLVGSPLQAVCSLPQVGFTLLPVGGPCLAIHPRRCIMIEAVIRLPQSVDGLDMLPQRRHPFPALPCCLASPLQRP
jgi:hypothetical protein